MPRPDKKALGAAHRGSGGGATRRQRQPVAQNSALGTGKVDGKGVYGFAKEGKGMASRID